MAKNRPLRNVYQRLGNFDSEIERIIAEQGRADILEVGCGLGLPMIQLIRKFRGKVHLTGINKDAAFNQPRQAMIEGIKKRALMPWVPFTHEWHYDLPKYVNCDASLPLPFEDNAFDFCYSIATVFFIANRFGFLAELNRVLRPGRTARVHFSYSLREFREFRGSEWNDNDTSLVSIEDAGGNSQDFRDFVSNFPAIRFFAKGSYEYLELTAGQEPIDFGLDFLGSRSMAEVSPEFNAGFQRSEYRMR